MEQLVDPAWLAGEMGAPDLRILDCSVVFERHDGVLTVGSGLSAWAEGHIPGSEHVDLVADLSDQASEMRFMMPPAAQFAAAMEGKGVGEGTRVVLYDDDRNMWAARVWWMLRAYGFDEAAVLDGGRRRWTVEGRELTVDPPVEHRAVFILKPRSGLLVDKAAVLAGTRDDGTCIVNALSAAHHNGESDDYGRRGHIPTSVNMPAADLVDPDTHAYLDMAALRSRFAPVLDSPAERVITYCGGGISAASDAFALTLLGADEVAIYDASMGEWGIDPSLPLVVPGAPMA